MAPGIFHGSYIQDLRSPGGELEHFLTRDAFEFAGPRNDARVGGEDAVDIRVDLADVGTQGGREGDRGRVRPAPAERGDVLGVAVEALEAGDDRHGSFVEGITDAPGGHVYDARGAVAGIRDHAGLAAGERGRVVAHALDGHRQQ